MTRWDPRAGIAAQRRSPLGAPSLVAASFALGALLAAPRRGHADEAERAPSATDAASAEVLFKKARALQDAGRNDEACAAFDESYRLDPAPGTLLNLGACSRSKGKTATAWSQFVEAERLFRRRADERRADFAKGEAAALEAGLSHLVLEAPAPPKGLVVVRDGVEMRSLVLRTPLPVDPGPHELVAKADGRVPFKTTFTVVAGKDVTVRIPELAVAPDDLKAGASPETSPNRGKTQRTLGWAAGGVGVGTLVVGGIFVGLVAERKSAADPHCPEKRCDATGQAAIDRANTFANVANVTIPVGAVLTGVGVVLLATAPKAPRPLRALHVHPTVSASGAFVGIDAEF
jgi:hypothetical protein